MPESYPPFKRRRIDGAVQKPFKSPIRTPLKPTSTPSLNKPLLVAQSPLQKYTSVDDQRAENTVLGKASCTFVPHIAKSDDGVRISRRSIQPITPRSSQSSQLQRLREIETQIRKTCRENDQFKQAITIIKSNKDVELEKLIGKWRSAAQLAADAVYGTARDKVNRMGGVEGLREQERESKERRKQWEKEDKEFQVQKKLKEIREMVADGEATEDDVQRFILQSKEKPEEQYLDDYCCEKELHNNIAKDEDVSNFQFVLRKCADLLGIYDGHDATRHAHQFWHYRL